MERKLNRHQSKLKFPKNEQPCNQQRRNQRLLHNLMNMNRLQVQAQQTLIMKYTFLETQSMLSLRQHLKKMFNF